MGIDAIFVHEWAYLDIKTRYPITVFIVRYSIYFVVQHTANFAAVSNLASR